MSTARASAPGLEPIVQQQQPNPAEHLFQIGLGYMASMALNVAVELRIADHLANGARSTSELATLTHVNEDRLYRVLRALASVGVFTEVAPHQFGLTPAAELLRSDVEGSQVAMMRWISDSFHYRIYAEMMHSVKTGEIAFDHIFGEPIFEYLPENDKKEAAVFNDAMVCLSNMVAPEVLKAYDFSGIGTLMDVGGGHGALLSCLLRRYPEMRGLVFDMEPVIEGALAAECSADVRDRCRFVAGDFFQSVPRGADAIIMKHIIHDWDGEKAVQILKNCREALSGKPGAKVLLVESVLTQDNKPHLGKLIDVEMFMFVGGRERTEEQFRDLLAAAGLRLNRVIPTQAPLWVVEAMSA
jgi:hypothetical protein